VHVHAWVGGEECVLRRGTRDLLHTAVEGGGGWGGVEGGRALDEEGALLKRKLFSKIIFFLVVSLATPLPL